LLTPEIVCDWRVRWTGLFVWVGDADGYLCSDRKGSLQFRPMDGGQRLIDNPVVCTTAIPSVTTKGGRTFGLSNLALLANNAEPAYTFQQRGRCETDRREAS
jgi:hypothetical protein